MSLCFKHQLVYANNAAYEQRRNALIDSTLQNSGGNGITLILQAYRNLPLDTAALNARLVGAPGDDFSIIQWVRLLCLSNGSYNSQILPPLFSVPYWINYGDTTHGYWSENHMIMWMSSDWILHERFGKPCDTSLHTRLVHYLDLKNQFGFYEYFSSTYNPFTLAGLLNLSDFALDNEIKAKATSAALRLMKTMLMLANDKGTYFPSAGRNYPSKYVNAYGQSHNNIIYLLTGLGPFPGGASITGACMVTSNFEMDSASVSWTPKLDTIFHVGHTLDTGFIINGTMTPLNKTIFQWSSGAYFHPEVVSETVQLLTDSNMWQHTDFKIFSPLAAIVTPQSAPALAEQLSCISKSSVICNEDIAIFKHHSITLSSTLDFWKGKVGFQQYPCVANVGTTAVFTSSGQVKQNWDDRNPSNQNIHLPYVMQKKNLALIMYRPEYVPTVVGNAYTYKDVALHFKDGDFDEIVNDSMWLLGRQQNSYVAVRRSCIGEIDSVRACPTNGGQTWVIMVGDSSLYGNFTNFQTLVHQSQFVEQWYFDSLNQQSVYYAKIVMDTTTIEYAWGVDSTTTGLSNLSNENLAWTVFPNPASSTLHIAMEKLTEPMWLNVYSVTGELMVSKPVSENQIALPVSSFNEGIYTAKLFSESGKVSVKRFIVNH
jgi:hypothetical protein